MFVGKRKPIQNGVPACNIIIITISGLAAYSLVTSIMLSRSRHRHGAERLQGTNKPFTLSTYHDSVRTICIKRLRLRANNMGSDLNRPMRSQEGRCS